MRYLIISGLILLSSCNKAIDPQQLYGHWKYVSLIKPNGSRPDTLSSLELDVQNPSINFTAENQLYMVWGGETFSKGSFEIKGSEIMYTETIPGGTRTFPFRILHLDEARIIFETTNGGEATRVTAEKVKQ